MEAVFSHQNVDDNEPGREGVLVSLMPHGHAEVIQVHFQFGIYLTFHLLFCF